LVREGHRVDERAEWRTFDEDKGSKERAGGPVNPLLDDGGLSNSTSIQLQPGLQHLARVQAMLKDPNKKLKQGFSVIGDMCGTLKLGNMVRDRACELYKDSMQHLKERKVHEACAACIYVACRIEKCPRTFKEITAASRDTHMVIIMRCFKTIVNKLGIQQSSLDTVKPSDYIDRFCSSLRMSKLGLRLAQHLAQLTSDKTNQAVWDGKSPISIAAGIIVLVSEVSREDAGLTIQTISSHTGASTSAIRSAWAVLEKEKAGLIPDWFKKEEDAKG